MHPKGVKGGQATFNYILTQIMHLASLLCHFAMIQIPHALSGFKIFFKVHHLYPECEL
jgi:hypothetical protein